MRSQRAARWGLGCAGLLAMTALAPATPPEPRTEPVQAGPSAPVQAASEAKVKAATEILTMCREFLVAPPGQRGTPPAIEVAEQIQYWSRALTDAKLEAATSHEDRLKILSEAVDRAKGFEAEVKDLTGNEESGLTKLSFAKAVYYRADAQSRLIRETATDNKAAK